MRTAAAFAPWVAVGAGGALGVLTAPSIGLFVLPAAVALGALLAWRGTGRLAWPGIVAGLGLPLLYVGYLNRGGPGVVCSSTALSETCTQQTSPWPWVGAGLALVLAGALWLTMARSAAQRRR